MDSDISISIVIPAFNEEKRIATCLDRVIQYCTSQRWDFEIIVAEDGSKDNTVKIVNGFIEKDKRLRLISFPNRIGKGAAIRNAILTSGKKIAGFMDVDLAADPSEFQRLIQHIDNYDLVIGSRLLRGDLP